MSNASRELKSRVPGIRWPAVLDNFGNQLTTLLYQFEQSQWLTAAQIKELQWRQLDELLRHAGATVPFYAQRLAKAGWKHGAEMTDEQWLDLPLLTREELQAQYESLCSRSIPPSHGAATVSQTSGSTGQPVRYMSTGVTQLMWAALTLRFHLWQGHDFSGRLCSIRAGHGELRRDVQRRSDWGAPINLLFATGPAAMMDCRNDASALVDWLLQDRPDYLIGLPSTLVAMAKHCLEQGINLQGLRQVCTYAEMLGEETREVICEAWSGPVADMYSCQEAGYLALQCPSHQHYHVQSENVLVEVINDHGRPCGPGEIGRVVVTALHNFATPLIRYELLDYAQVGEPCPCGRGLPVIAHIKGRLRNLITLPDGQRHWPVLYASTWSGIAPIRQLQLIQKTPGHFDAKVVIDRDLTPTEETALSRAIGESLGYPFTFRFLVQSERIVSRTGKFESIVSQVGIAAAEQSV